MSEPKTEVRTADSGNGRLDNMARGSADFTNRVCGFLAPHFHALQHDNDRSLGTMRGRVKLMVGEHLQNCAFRIFKCVALVRFVSSREGEVSRCWSIASAKLKTPLAALCVSSA